MRYTEQEQRQLDIKSGEELDRRATKRFTYARSRLDPPFWTILRGDEHIAEAWEEKTAKMIVRSLNRSSI